MRSGSDPDDLVVDYRRGMYAVEQYLFARSYMHPAARPRHARQLYESLPLGRPRSTIRLVCAPELVDELRPLAEAAARG